MKKIQKINVLDALQDDEETRPQHSLKRLPHTIMSQKSADLIKEAQEQDAEIFDYDGVYDDLKEQELLRKKSRDGSNDSQDPNGRKKARYIEGIMKASAKR